MRINSSIPKEEKRRNPSINRAQRRTLLHDKAFMIDLLATIHAYFPDLFSQLKGVKDPRHKNYTKYNIAIMLLERILAALSSIESMRSETAEFNDENMIKNIADILQLDSVGELPAHDAINNCFKALEPTELEAIIHSMIENLIRRNTFKNSRIREKYWQVLIDGTSISSFNHRHCDKCLFRRHKNKNGDVTSVEFYHYVLEAKLVIHENLVFSICTEFVENEFGIPPEEELYSKDFDEPSKEKAKQDCELKAFYRLAVKLKSLYPKLPICITADGLYPCKQVFEICQNNGWHYILRFKEDSIRNLYSLYMAEADNHMDQFFSIRQNGTVVDYGYVNNLKYEDFTLSMAECRDYNVSHLFLFLTDLHLDRKNCVTTINDGRRRWRIENEGFKIQKQNGYYLKHVFSKNYNAMKIHYYLIQIAHFIDQLFRHGSAVLKEIKNITIKIYHETIKKCLCSFVLDPDDYQTIRARKRITLSP